MQLRLKQPELEKFIDEQVNAGNFPTREAAVEAAVIQMKMDHATFRLTDADTEAITESDAQIDRGEYVEFDEFAAEMRKKYCKD